MTMIDDYPAQAVSLPEVVVPDFDFTRAEHIIAEQKTLDVLEHSLKLLRDGQGWVKGTLRSSNATGASFCTVGTIQEAAKQYGVNPDEALSRFRQFEGISQIESYNDSGSTQFGDIENHFAHTIAVQRHVVNKFMNG